jgi:hypothetical protein
MTPALEHSEKVVMVNGIEFDFGLDPLQFRFGVHKDFENCEDKQISGSVFPYHKF